MSKGICGYGRYDDDPEHVGCPRAQSDMTPCVARDGHAALADAPQVCVGCGSNSVELLKELAKAGVSVDVTSFDKPQRVTAANYLTTVVRR
jgi:hypothetical protein